MIKKKTFQEHFNVTKQNINNKFHEKKHTNVVLTSFITNPGHKSI